MPSFANDTTATVTPSAIEFTHNPNISMDEEILTISDSKIEVLYRFTNHSQENLSLDVAFPLPLAPIDKEPDSARVYPSWDESYLSYRLLGDNPLISNKKEIYNNNLYNMLNKGKPPLIDFERTVNGQSYGYNYRIIAKTQDDKDITETLVKNNIPISATYLIGFMEEGKLAQDKSLKEKLAKLNLLDEKGFPIWRNQTIYYWKQLFPAKETITVSHTYTPHAGQFFLTLPKKGQSEKDIKFYHRDLDDKKLSDFYQTKELEEYIQANLKNSLLIDQYSDIRVQEIDYILTTGNHWKGPIKKFTLNVIPPKNAKLGINKEYPLQRLNEDFVYSRENFIPSKDLKILFILPEE